MEENSLSPTNLSRGRPIKTSTTFVLGRSHEFLEDERKIRKLQLCSYCKGVIQREREWVCVEGEWVCVEGVGGCGEWVCGGVMYVSVCTHDCIVY